MKKFINLRPPNRKAPDPELARAKAKIAREKKKQRKEEPKPPRSPELDTLFNPELFPDTMLPRNGKTKV